MISLVIFKMKTRSEQCQTCFSVFDKRTVSSSLIKESICPYCSDPEDIQDRELLLDMVHTIQEKILDLHRVKKGLAKALDNLRRSPVGVDQ